MGFIPLKGNTALKITGRQTEPDTLASIAKITNTDPEEIRRLKVGQYHIKIGELDSVQIDGKTNCLDSVNSMKAEQWETLKARQLAVFYCKEGGDTLQPDTKKQTLKIGKRNKKRGLN